MADQTLAECGGEVATKTPRDPALVVHTTRRVGIATVADDHRAEIRGQMPAQSDPVLFSLLEFPARCRQSAGSADAPRLSQPLS